MEAAVRASTSRLLRDIRGREAKFLFVVVQAMNYHFGPRLTEQASESFSYYGMPLFRVMVCLRGILDTLLGNGHNQIESEAPQEFLQIFGRLSNYFSIAKYSHVLNVQRTHPLQRARIDREEIDEGQLY